jgi:hypothetical protein
MTEQLSLFHPTEDLVAAAPLTGEADAGAVDELFRRCRRWRSRCGFLELLEFIAALPAYSPLNGFLMYLQDPAATRVATARMWERRYQRRLKPDARPLVILAPMSPVLFVFDIRDTEGPTLPASTQPARGGGLAPRLLETTRHNCGLQHIAVRETGGPGPSAERTIRLTPALRKRHAELGLDPNSRYLVLLDAALSLEAKYAALTLELGRIFCGHLGIDSDAWWPERGDLDFDRIEIEAAAVAHLVCRRRGFAAAPAGFLAECLEGGQELAPFSLNAVFQAASHIETMSKRAWKKARRQGR